MSRYQIKNKKYALRKIGKYVGSVVIGLALMGFVNIPKVQAGGATYTYTVNIPAKKKYVADDTKDFNPEDDYDIITNEDATDGSQVVSENGDVAGAQDYFNEHQMSYLLEQLFDKDHDGNLDDKYKQPPYPLSKKPDSDGNGVIDDEDDDVTNTFYSSTPIFKSDANATENVVNDDGTVTLSKYYNIENVDPVDFVYKIGTKPTTSREKIPFTTIHRKNDQLAEGDSRTIQNGKDGEQEVTTTYTVDENTGERTAHVANTRVITPAEDEIIEIGTKPKKEKPASTDVKYQPKVGGTKLGEAKVVPVTGDSHSQGESVSYTPEPEITVGDKVYVPAEGGNKTVTLTDKPQTVDVEYVEKPASTDGGGTSTGGTSNGGTATGGTSNGSGTSNGGTSNTATPSRSTVGQGQASNPASEISISDTNRKNELPNTGTESNAGIASAGIITLLAGLGLGFLKKKEDEES